VTRRRHRPSCGHCPRVRQLGRDFQAWRASFDQAEESASAGYATERAAWRAGRQAPTFRRYLEQMTGAGWPMSGSWA